MMKIGKLFVINFLALFFAVNASAQKKSEVTATELRTHVEYLASQELKGRYPGTPGDKLAAEFIKKAFKDYGLKFFTQDGFQSFTVTTGVEEGPGNSLVFGNRKAELNKDFIPMPLSDNGEISGEVVLVGYGFRLDLDTLKWDDFKGVDIRGKVAIILLGAPEPDKNSKEDPFESQGSIRSKLLQARDAGARGVILVAGPAYDEKDELDFGTLKENSAGLPVIRIKRSFLNECLIEKGLSIESIEKKLNTTHSSVSAPLGIRVQMKTEVISDKAETRNIIGFLPPAAATDSPEYVIVGAHYDHLGMGGPGSNSRVPDTVGVHCGADDNASGVSAVIEMAGRIAVVSSKLKRGVIFVAFAGEEMGLLGSKYFVEHSPVPIGTVTAMFNLDMVGRPNEEKRITISGTGTAAEMDSLLNLMKPGQLTYSRSPEGYGPSDHASFYSAGIPVFYFSTGAHLDYHTPADTPDKLNYVVMKDLSDQVADLILSVANARGKLNFRESGPKTNESGRRKLKVTLGIMPDVSGTENNGLRVEFATPGKPAQLAGIQKGDRIVGINGMPVTNVYDYMTRLQTLKSGQTVSVELMRNDKKIVVLVQL